MLKLKDLRYQVGAFSLGIPSLEIPKGVFQVILGPSGAGKSLLLELLLGLLKPCSGQIFSHGQDITFWPPEKRGFGYVPQDLALFPHLTVEENIFLASDRREPWLEELLSFLGLETLLKRSIDGLSGGERQRVALARALAPGGKVLLLDEPFTALHRSLRQELWFLLRALKERFDLTVILVTHDLEEAFFLGEKVAILVSGRLLEDGPAERVYFTPQSLAAARLLGVRNLFSAEVHSRRPPRVKVPSLKTILELERELPEKAARGWAGLRAEEVLVLRPEYRRPHQKNLLEVQIERIFFQGSTYLILARRERERVEIVLPLYAFRKLKPCPGDRIQVIFPPESLFWLSESQ